MNLFITRTRFGMSASLAALLLVFSGVAATEGPFWKVSGANGTAYLFGSVHFGTDEIYPLDAAVENAFARADRLAVEVNLQAVNGHALGLWMAQHGAIADGATLSDTVSPETWRLLQRRAEELGVPAGAFAFQRPWLAAFSMTALALVREGFREELGIDRHFLTRATGEKPIRELETIETQMGLLAGLPPEVEAHFLHMTLEDLGSRDGVFPGLFQAWKRGDAEAIRAQSEDMRAGPHGQALFSRLIEQRNENMAEGIARILEEEGGTTFVVVGAAHLVGPDGVASLLASRGYRVEKR
ncbi:MAG TPA: TraB/GumN family protein [Gammaproteobacteria bacterium]